jgi:hypothetical protein
VLNYRSAPQHVVDELLGDKTEKLPIIEMVEVSRDVIFN